MDSTASSQSALDLLRILSAIQDPPHDADVAINSVIDGKWKSLGEEPVVAKALGMHASVQFECVDIGEE